MGEMREDIKLMSITNKAFQIFGRSNMKKIKHPSSRKDFNERLSKMSPPVSERVY